MFIKKYRNERVRRKNKTVDEDIKEQMKRGH